jgi:hypothetical protein
MLWVIIVEPYIKSFESFIDVHEDGVIVVKERIVVDFGEESMYYGIYRKIPYYLQGRELELKLISAEDDSGERYQVSEEEKDGEVYWVIRDPKASVEGERVYNIKYEVKGAINYFEDYDEIYWNVNGKWEMKIQEILCIVNLPDYVDVNKVKYTFYTDKEGSKEQNDKAWVEENKVFFKAGPFKPGENLTIAISLPKGILIDQTDENLTTSVGVPKSASIEPSESSWISRNWGLLFMILLPLITLLYALAQYFLLGRDPKIDKSVMVEYEPPDNLKPAEVGALIDEYADDRDIVATIIDLAIRGYLKIKPLEEGNVEIEILRDGEDLEGYEREIFEVIKKSAKDGKVVEPGESVKNYSGSLEQQEAKEYKRSVLEVIKDKIYDSLIQKGYFKESPKETRRTYIELGTLMFFIGLGITLAYAYLEYGMLGYVSVFLLLTVFLIIISLFSFHVGRAAFFIGFAIGLFCYADYLSQYGVIERIVGTLFYLFITILSLIAFGLIVSLIRSLLVRFFNFAITPTSITNTEDWEISFPTFLFISLLILILSLSILSLISNDNMDKNVGILTTPKDIKNVGILTILKDILQSPVVNLALGILLSGIIIYFIGRHMAKKTKKGVEMYKRILGFKEFLERVDEDRLKRMMEEDPTKLERMLPYAIVLGVEDKWMGKIRDIVYYVQSWMYFVEDIRDIGRAVSSLEASVNSLSSEKKLGRNTHGGGTG